MPPPGDATAAATPDPDPPRAEASVGAADTPAPRHPPPGFDVVRVDAQGGALVAGTAPARFVVWVEVDGVERAQARADDLGAFAALFDLPLTDAPQVMTLVARGPAGEEIRSEDSVILAPRPAPPPAIAADAPPAGLPALAPPGPADAPADVAGLVPVRPDRPTAAPGAGVAPERLSAAAGGAVPAGAAIAGRASTAAPGPAGPAGAPAPAAVAGPDAVAVAAPASGGAPVTLAPAPAAPAGASRAGRAPAVLLADATGVRLLQPATAEPAAGDRVAIEIISYDDDGSVLLEGRSKKPPPVARRVQVYLDNAPLQTVEIAEDGSWRTPLPKVESGVYTLRVDQVDEAGAVVSRFETPFKREDPAELARFAPSAGAGEVSAAVITVQPGFTLWGIANDRYGLGLRYVQVFEANRDQIRDPDLIYPGQVFKLPPVAP